MLISILITASGFLGVVLTVFFIFFEVKNPIKITKRDLVGVIIWLTLLILGIVNLYYIHSEQSSDEETDFQEPPVVSEEDDGIQETDDESMNLSEEELLVRQNYDLIQQSKGEYSDSDTKIIESDSVKFWIYEKAGYIFQDLMKTGECYILQGDKVPPAKVIILDYSSDEIIYVFSPEESNTIHYSPENQNKFYCIVFHDDYDIYITPPIQVVGGDANESVEIGLDKKDSQYTSLYQIRLYLRDLKSDEPYSVVSENYEVGFCSRNIFSGSKNTLHRTKMSDTGILSWGDCAYFSLNTRYVLDFFLYSQSDPESELASQTFDGSVTDSNLVEIFLESDSGSDALK